MTHKKPITKLIAGVLSVVMVFGVLMLVSPTEAQAISLNATDTGFYNLAYGANGRDHLRRRHADPCDQQDPRRQGQEQVRCDLWL